MAKESQPAVSNCENYTVLRKYIILLLIFHVKIDLDLFLYGSLQQQQNTEIFLKVQDYIVKSTRFLDSYKLYFYDISFFFCNYSLDGSCIVVVTIMILIIIIIFNIIVIIIIFIIVLLYYYYYIFIYLFIYSLIFAYIIKLNVLQDFVLNWYVFHFSGDGFI